MNIEKYLFMGTFVSFCLIVLCASCSSATSRRDVSKEIHFVLNPEPRSLDPRMSGSFPSPLMLYQLFEGLTRYGASGEPELALAESIDVSEDRTTYTFHLRPSKWSNGEPVTAMDFEYAWKSVLSFPPSAPYAPCFFVIQNVQKAFRNKCSIDDVGIRSLDSQTLQVTLENPAPYFLEWTSHPLYAPLYRPMAESVQHWSQEVFPTYVCNGPYILKEYRPRSLIILEKNPLYWNVKDCAKTYRLCFSIIEDPITAYNMFKAGDVDWFGAPFSIDFPSEVIAKLEADGLLHSSRILGTSRIDCCVTRPHLASVKIRRALACAINRRELVTNLLIGDEPATSIVTKNFSLLPKPQFEDGNVEMAKRLFDEGCAELGFTKETYPCLVLTSRPLYKALAEVIARQIHAALGITVRAETCEMSIFRKKRASLELELALLGLSSTLRDPILELGWFKFNDTGLTACNWDSPEYRRLLDASDRTKDANERTAFLSQAELLIANEMPAIPLVYEVEKYAKNPHIVGDYFVPVSIPELKRFEKVD